MKTSGCCPGEREQLHLPYTERHRHAVELFPSRDQPGHGAGRSSSPSCCGLRLSAWSRGGSMAVPPAGAGAGRGGAGGWGGGEGAGVGSCPRPCSAPPNTSMRSDCLVSGHPGLLPPVQTWSSAANFRNDLSTRLLLSHWRGGGRRGAVREGGVSAGAGRGAAAISSLSLLSWPGGSLRWDLGRPLGREWIP